jgi:hypothetical protein
MTISVSSYDVRKTAGDASAICPAKGAESSGTWLAEPGEVGSTSIGAAMTSRPDSANLIGRREFTLESAMALLSTVVITFGTACGGNKTTTPTTPTPTPVGDVTGTISANHGHTAVVTSAQITTANAVSLDIRGTASHPHTVQLTQADLRSLQSRQTVAKESTNDNGHMHTVTFTPS